jgi:hypothetical protein
MSPSHHEESQVDLSAALEELTTAEEELRAQNEQLAAARIRRCLTSPQMAI